MAPQLPDEIVEEIALRLPPDYPASLVRAALVCKRWSRLISDRIFRCRYRERHREPPMLGLVGNLALTDGAARFMSTATRCAFRPARAICTVSKTKSSGPLSLSLLPWPHLDWTHGSQDKASFQAQRQGIKQSTEQSSKLRRREITCIMDELMAQCFTTQSLGMQGPYSAVLGELMTRSINFIINRCSKPPVMSVEESLQRALLRAQAIVEEAMGRRITNQAMIQQLGMLRDTMHQGCYALDAFRYQLHYGEDGSDPAIRGFMTLSKVPYFSSQNAKFLEQLQDAFDRLSSMIADLDVLAVFLTSYPPLYRQPYSMHILLSNCMFGRQVEAELVIRFLLHTHPHSSDELDVLPIVGPPKVGKSTLVAHVCRDERVHDYFSEILWLQDYDVTDDKLAFSRGFAMKHQNEVSNSNKGKRLLVVIELSGDLYEDAWNRLYLASKQRFCRGSKILVTSCSDKIVKFGTRQALTLKHLSHEAYWYFFKTLTFGSLDPEMHPRHVQLALEIARMQNRSINAAYIMCYLLRDNFNIHFWCKVLSFFRMFVQKYVSKFSEHPFDLTGQNKPVQFGRMAAPSEDIIICESYHRSSQEEVPEIRAQDVVYGSIKTHRKFEVLIWRAQIPPYYTYVNTYETRERKTSGTKRKRSMKHGVTFC